MKFFIHYYYLMLTSPQRAFRELKNDTKKLVHTRNAFILLALLFIIPNLTMVIISAESPIPPIVIIPVKYFYHWITFVGIPAQVPLFIMISGCIYLLSSSRESSADFKESFAMTTFSLSLPFFIYALFEISFAVYLVATGSRVITMPFMIFMFSAMGVTVLGHIFYLTKGIRETFGLTRIKSLSVSIGVTLLFWISASFFFA